MIFNTWKYQGSNEMLLPFLMFKKVHLIGQSKYPFKNVHILMIINLYGRPKTL